jgi:F0F1-type ATP synthase assembly protein I
MTGFAEGDNTMFRLTPPKHVTFYISVAVAIIAVILHYTHIAIPHVTHSNFVTLLIGYLVLLAGNVLEGV